MRTPAPWQVSNGNYGISRVFSTAEDSRPFYLASEITREADAKLIAAAPDLLRELLQVRDAIIGPSIDRTARDRLVTVGQRMELSLDRINTALKKAGL